ncbi:SPOSA6832_00904 [Sporobolomyces salmonicolor]|uniref:SPOSA6832_00904-mRNA-1:cds n=1 Tax=Sporidiobolus salmonicolor TaxID=5005 RepID=A0A0D6EH87_SPOSA|nr:SPOSA6832_00904 [Sporobolomyces salmonicolor]
MLPDSILTHCKSPETVTTRLGQSPEGTPVHDVAEKLFMLPTLTKLAHKLTLKSEVKLSDPTGEDLDQACDCGKFGGTRPSELFLKNGEDLGGTDVNPGDHHRQIYYEALCTLEKDPLVGLVSPSLMGSTGVIPLSIVSVIPDIIQHYCDVIVRAKKEIIFATNFWEASGSATMITDAFKELSRRAGERGERVVIKLMYDRGTPTQVVKQHQLVDEKDYTADRVQLPSKEEIPNIDMEVLNFHRPPVGTFHAKYRASLQFSLSHKPLLTLDCRSHRRPRDRPSQLEQHPRKALFISLISTRLTHRQATDRVNVEFMSHIEGPIVEAFYDMALISWNEALNPTLPLLNSPPPTQREYHFGENHEDIKSKDIEGAQQSSRQLLKGQNKQATAEEAKAEGQDQLQSKVNENPPSAGTYDQDNTVEANRDSSFSDEKAINQHLNTGTPVTSTATLPSSADLQFRPHILHSPHKPFPCALVNRRPHGKPAHNDTRNPQDAAWLAALRYAKEKVFIQTPTFNAPLAVDAALEAVKRGIEVTIFADLGFNDEGELLPFQGGTNEMVAIDMYKRLETEEAKNRLRWYWYVPCSLLANSTFVLTEWGSTPRYTGKDQNIPLNAKEKARNCHVKVAPLPLMIVDDSVGIQGNGNMDAQSWYHSQEINILVDSAQVCKEWQAGIRANQNTHLYGALDQDGIWRDQGGKLLPGAKSPPKGPLKSLVGVKGAVERVRGEGGF